MTRQVCRQSFLRYAILGSGLFFVVHHSQAAILRRGGFLPVLPVLESATDTISRPGGVYHSSVLQTVILESADQVFVFPLCCRQVHKGQQAGGLSFLLVIS